MVDYATAPLSEIVTAVVDDGVVDAAEVTALKARLYEDGIIDREEADALFAINDAVTGNENDPSWAQFFVEALTDHVLADEVSPDELDEDEWNYLKGKIEGDGQLDSTEKSLLESIQSRAKSVPDDFSTYAQSNLASA